jgi:hypothetical protein
MPVAHRTGVRSRLGTVFGFKCNRLVSIGKTDELLVGYRAA